MEQGADDDSPLCVSTGQLAEKFVQYYWRQSAPFLPDRAGGRVLHQNTGRQAGIVQLIHGTHSRCEGSLVAARHDPLAWKELIQKVAQIVRVMPLWKLQTVGGESLEFLYANTGAGSRITLKPGVAYCFRKHYGLVSDMVKGAWARYVRRFNVETLGDRTDLGEFLFGSERANLKTVGLVVAEVQAGTCFYCHRGLKGEMAHVDHFIPWARYPVDLGHNFVLAHAACNTRKSDRLAAMIHLQRWCEFQQQHADRLTVEFDRLGISNDFQSSVRIVNWAYRQTFEVHGLTWLQNQELQPLAADWNQALTSLMN